MIGKNTKYHYTHGTKGTRDGSNNNNDNDWFISGKIGYDRFHFRVGRIYGRDFSRMKSQARKSKENMIESLSKEFLYEKLPHDNLKIIAKYMFFIKEPRLVLDVEIERTPTNNLVPTVYTRIY